MKRKLALSLVLVIALNLMATFSTLLPVTVMTPLVANAEATRTTYPIYSENFDEAAGSPTFSTTAALSETAFGWGHTGTLTTFSGTALTGYGKYLSVLANANFVYKAFDKSIQVTSVPGATDSPSYLADPGKNAKLVVQFDFATVGASTTSSNRFGIALLSGTSTSSSIGASVYINPPLTEDGWVNHSNFGATTPNPTPTYYIINKTGAVTNTTIRNWHTVKFEISLTDSNGDFVNKATQLQIFSKLARTDANWRDVTGGTGVSLYNNIKFIDRIGILSNSSSLTVSIDNIEIYIEKDKEEGLIKTDLFDAIYDATQRLANTQQGTLPGQFSTSARSALSTAISTAQGVYDTAATQAELDTAVGNLESALTTYNNAMVPLADKTDLAAIIASADLVYSSSYEGTAQGQFPAADRTTLSQAITAAKTVNNTSTALQTEVDAAEEALGDAVTAYNASVIPMTTYTGTSLFSENFNGYVDNDDLQTNSGWTHSVGITNLTVEKSTGNSSRNLRVVNNGGYATKTFNPIPLSAAGGASPGKNATLVASYRVARDVANDSNYHYVGFADSDRDESGTGPSALLFASGNRGPDASCQWRYGQSFSSAAAGKPLVLGNFANSAAKWAEIKYIVKVTDENGDFYAAPIVNVYVDGVQRISETFIRTNNKLDSILVGGLGTSVRVLVDDIDVKLVCDAPTVTVTIDQDKGFILNEATGKAITTGSVSVPYNTAFQYKVVAYSGYQVKTVTTNSVPTTAGSFIYTGATGNLKSDATIAVDFEAYDLQSADAGVVTYDEVFKDDNTAVVYGTIYGTSAEFGIIMWDTAIAGNSDIAIDNPGINVADSGIRRIVAKGSQKVNSAGQFCIIMQTLDAGSYKARTYAKGASTVYYGATVSFTIS